MANERWQARVLRKTCDGRAYLKAKFSAEDKFRTVRVFSTPKDAQTAFEMVKMASGHWYEAISKIDEWSSPKFVETYIFSCEEVAKDFKKAFHKRVYVHDNGHKSMRVIKLSQLEILNPTVIRYDPKTVLKAQEAAIDYDYDVETELSNSAKSQTSPSESISDRQRDLIELIETNQNARKAIEEYEKQTHSLAKIIDNEKTTHDDYVDLKGFAELIGASPNRLWQINAHAMRALSEGSVLFYGGAIFPMACPFGRKKLFDYEEVTEFLKKTRPKKKGKYKPVRIDKFDKHQNKMLSSVICAKEFIEDFPVDKWKKVGVDPRFKAAE
jgi:hypothetical protein